ncbi:MAG: AAA family ATPase [Actinomycetota bacterium]|nr:AAA family ATPase [Actinomycetota bacterium]
MSDSGQAAPGELLERAAELQRIESLFDAASGGSGSVLMVEGAPGIGKSELLAEPFWAQRERSGPFLHLVRGDGKR